MTAIFHWKQGSAGRPAVPGTLWLVHSREEEAATAAARQQQQQQGVIEVAGGSASCVNATAAAAAGSSTDSQKRIAHLVDESAYLVKTGLRRSNPGEVQQVREVQGPA